MARRTLSQAPLDLTKEQRRALLEWVVEQADKSDGYANRYWHTLSRKRTELRFEVDRCLDWHRAKGTMHKDWVAAVRNWLRIACRSYMRKQGVQVGVD